MNVTLFQQMRKHLHAIPNWGWLGWRRSLFSLAIASGRLRPNYQYLAVGFTTALANYF